MALPWSGEFDRSHTVTRIVDPAEVAATFRDELRREIRALPEPLLFVGFLAADHGPSATYAEYTRRGSTTSACGSSCAP